MALLKNCGFPKINGKNGNTFVFHNISIILMFLEI